MDSSQIPHKNLQNHETLNPNSHNHNPKKNPSHSYNPFKRTTSFSSSSSLYSQSSSSNNPTIDNSPSNTPTSSPARLVSGGVPFSWEHFPGMPKQQLSEKKPNKSSSSSSSTKKLLPLVPPPTISLEHTNNGGTIIRVKKTNSFSSSTTNHNKHRSFETDPFIAALVECSKDEARDQDLSSANNTSSAKLFWSLATAKVSRSLSDRLGFVGIYVSCKKTCAVAESIRHLPRSARRSYDLINSRSR